jgi:hypothetical protein
MHSGNTFVVVRVVDVSVDEPEEVVVVDEVVVDVVVDELVLDEESLSVLVIELPEIDT